MSNSSLGTNPENLRTTAMSLSNSTAEYCAPVWGKVCHARKIDPGVKKSCMIITGSLRPNPLPSCYRLAGIAPPHIRKETRAKTKKPKQKNDPGYTLYGYVKPRIRLKSRSAFMTTIALQAAKLKASSVRLTNAPVVRGGVLSRIPYSAVVVAHSDTRTPKLWHTKMIMTSCLTLIWVCYKSILLIMKWMIVKVLTWVSDIYYDDVDNNDWYQDGSFIVVNGASKISLGAI